MVIKIVEKIRSGRRIGSVKGIGIILNRIVKKGFIEKVIFVYGFEGRKSRSYVDIWGNSIL